MNVISALLFASIALFMVSCTSPIVKRIERNPDIYAALSPHHKDLVQQGRVEEGMTKKAVFLAWGKPDRAAKGSKNGREYEKWSYAGYEPTYTTGLGFGTSFGGYGHCGGLYDSSFFYEPMMTYVPYEAARVEFLNGIVTAWSASR
jgi:hypothetical protein